MDLQGRDHVYTCSPKLWFDPKGETVTVKLKCAPQSEIDAVSVKQSLLGPEATKKAGHEFISRFVYGIDGLSVGGKPITTYDELRDNGPDDFYTWIYCTVTSQEQLSGAEIKN